MNRGTRTLLVLLFAVVMAGVAAYGAFRAIQMMAPKQVAMPTRPVVVATASLPVGTLVGATNVKVIAWPADNPVQGGFSKPADVVGRGLVSAVVTNEPITETKLAPAASGAGLPPTIPQGMRALSVRVNEVIGVAGFVGPGARVDVLATVSQREETMTRTVVSNVQVLAAGSRIDQEQASRDGKPIAASVVTLAVTPEDAERIALAAGEGKIMLALRNPLDTLPTETSGARMASLLGAPAPPPVERSVKGKKVMVASPPPPAPPPAPKPYTVEAIRGAKRTEEIIK